MAQKLGYEELHFFRYYRMDGFDYNQDDVKQYHQEILKEVVPVALPKTLCITKSASASRSFICLG